MHSGFGRAGRYVQQQSGYRAFIPASLPPDPPLTIDLPLSALLSRADLALGRLDGVTSTLPDPDLFIAMYVRQEAVLSSQIEGTQSSLDHVLAFELDPEGHEIPADVTDVVNYVRALNYGLERLETLPLSLRLIRELHAILLKDERGAGKAPGTFRTSQNWIGVGNATLAQATFVPLPPYVLMDLLGDFERFLHADHDLPPLIHAGLAHSQFETVHPFLDGNRRIGRLLIAFQLCHRGVLHRPVLYLSTHLKRYRAEYYGRLMAVRENHQALLHAHRLERFGLVLLDLLFRHPLVNARWVERKLNVTYATANNLISRFVALGILDETTGRSRDRRFRYSSYLELFPQS